MPLADMQDASQQTPSEEPPTPSQEGYEITIRVTPQGLTVDGPEPLAQESEPDEQETGETLPDITTALKHVVAIYQENPISDDAHAQLKAGYNSP